MITSCSTGRPGPASAAPSGWWSAARPRPSAHKQDLLDGIAARVFEQVERLRALGLNAFETLNRHPAVEWFRRTVTPQRHPNLHRVMPALAGIDGVQDFRYQLDLFVRGLR
ncbi:hypothetical protein [Amycolatopsis sp. ATCC 39116]|uniref:hypothetical protein n=1 Tax=Amycolatopsis sp. (strain ATCC 39116 / 75iv2) TaxID=385957 RepID=UPI0002D64FCD